MGRAASVWARWKRFAHRAAEVQAHVLFFLLYFLAIVPMGLVRRALTVRRKNDDGGGPRWRPHDRSGTGLADARRQF